jgi:hypothetical protein
MGNRYGIRTGDSDEPGAGSALGRSPLVLSEISSRFTGVRRFGFRKIEEWITIIFHRLPMKLVSALTHTTVALLES